MQGGRYESAYDARPQSIRVLMVASDAMGARLLGQLERAGRACEARLIPPERAKPLLRRDRDWDVVVVDGRSLQDDLEPLITARLAISGAGARLLYIAPRHGAPDDIHHALDWADACVREEDLARLVSKRA